jgi:hypothetical protein
MAHSCPVCDSACHCGGDLEDVLLEEGGVDCTHCDSTEDEYDDYYDDEDEEC